MNQILTIDLLVPREWEDNPTEYFQFVRLQLARHGHVVQSWSTQVVPALTLEEARLNVGAMVIYERPHTPKEEGRIVRVNDTTVFVLYRGDLYPKGTNPEDLTLAYPIQGESR